MRHAWVFVVVSMLIVGHGSVTMAQESDQPGDQIRETVEQQASGVTFEEEITITGSMIPRPTLDALSPVTVMDAPEELTLTGFSRIEDLVTSLPQIFPAQSSRFANGADGTATVGLRYLGTNRTLILINGRRMASGNLFSGDLNVIPAPLVKRIDILTGGASTVYGSDAVAGVINFVLDTDFTGVRGGVQYSFFQHDNNNAWAQSINEEAGFEYPTGRVTDGDAVSANIAVGGEFADGRGHGSVYIDYRNIDEMTLAQRDYSACTVVRGADGPECGGSATSALGTFYAFGANGSFNGAYTLHTEEDGGDGHSFRPLAGEMFNYGPYNHVQRPDEKWNAGGFAHYTISDHFEPYLEVMVMRDFSAAQIAPSGNWTVNQINCDNPMMSDQQHDIVCVQGGYQPTDDAFLYMLRRNVEGGPRISQIGHTNFRLVGGLRGDIDSNWAYDLYGLQAENNSSDMFSNDLHKERMANALDVIVDPDTGEWICRSGSADGCVPWNIFQEGGVTQEVIDYMSTVAVMTTESKTQVFNLTFTGDLEGYGVALPSASEGLQIAVGGEHRSEALRIRPDEVYEQGLLAGSGGRTLPVSGEFDVSEFFFEALVPLVQDTRGFRDLSLELGYRYSDYSTSGGFNTYKGLLNWAITNSWRIRGGYNRAVRAANIYELFDPQRYGIGGFIDICANDPATGAPSATLEQCMRTGVTEEQYGTILAHPSNQYSVLWGGNPLLTPEVADTLTAGIVWTPQNIAGLSVTADYFNIEVTETIWSLLGGDILITCANTGDPEVCDLIRRDQQGSLWLTPDAHVETTLQNIGLLSTDGFDLHFNYLIGLGNAGYLSTDLVGTYLLTNKLDNRMSSYDCVGYYGHQCGLPVSRWRHRARATWETSFNAAFSLAWRTIGPAEIDDASPDPDLGDPGQMDLWRINNMDRIGTQNFFDLSATYTFRRGIQLAAGINNILDTEPPFPSLSANGWNGTYDPLGRYVFASVQFGF